VYPLANGSTVRLISIGTRTRRNTAERHGLRNLIGRSKKMQEIIALVRKVALSEASTVLLRGESGTGKDVLARAIHYESARSVRPFMNITCTALPDTLLESELFGHEKGSFTDAKAQKKGLFELADGGTVFLDEIGDMSPQLQSKLLRVLEEKRFHRVGAGVDIRVDVRVIAATNRDLEKAIQERAFREDLYYRRDRPDHHARRIANAMPVARGRGAGEVRRRERAFPPSPPRFPAGGRWQGVCSCYISSFEIGTGQRRVPSHANFIRIVRSNRRRTKRAWRNWAKRRGGQRTPDVGEFF